MTKRAVYLAKYSSSPRQRAHFSIFIPHAEHANRDLSGEGFRSEETVGTVIHVVGEPLMAGFKLEFKRNYRPDASKNLDLMVRLGEVNNEHLADHVGKSFSVDNTPKGMLEEVAAQVPPPPRGQNLRVPIDGLPQNDAKSGQWNISKGSQIRDSLTPLPQQFFRSLGIPRHMGSLASMAKSC